MLATALPVDGHATLPEAAAQFLQRFHRRQQRLVLDLLLQALHLPQVLLLSMDRHKCFKTSQGAKWQLLPQ